MRIDNYAVFESKKVKTDWSEVYNQLLIKYINIVSENFPIDIDIQNDLQDIFLDLKHMVNSLEIKEYISFDTSNKLNSEIIYLRQNFKLYEHDLFYFTYYNRYKSITRFVDKHRGSLKTSYTLKFSLSKSEINDEVKNELKSIEDFFEKFEKDVSELYDEVIYKFSLNLDSSMFGTLYLSDIISDPVKCKEMESFIIRKNLTKEDLIEILNIIK